MEKAEPALAPLHQQPGLSLAEFQEQVCLILRCLAVALELTDHEVYQLRPHSVPPGCPARPRGLLL